MTACTCPACKGTAIFATRLPRMRGRRARAWYWGAFGLGVAAGTAVGLLLEALRQSAVLP